MGKTYKTETDLLKDLTRKDREFKTKHPVLYRLRRVWYFIRYKFFGFFQDIPMYTKHYIQRSQRGYSDRDVWSFDFFLARVIYGGLLKLRYTGSGYPSSLTYKQWNKILDRILKGFKLICDIGEGNRSHYYPNMCIEYRKKNKCLNKREDRYIKEAFKLFTEYYFSLWD